MGDKVGLRFLTDEDVPRSTARVLRDAGFDAVNVRDVSLRGKSGREVFAYAHREGRLLITVTWAFRTFSVSRHRKIRGFWSSESQTANQLNISTARSCVLCRKWERIYCITSQLLK